MTAMPISSAPKDGTVFLGWNSRWKIWLLCGWDARRGRMVEAGDERPVRDLTHWHPLPPDVEEKK